MLLNIANNDDNYSNNISSRVTVALKHAKKNVISAVIAFLDPVSYRCSSVKKHVYFTYTLSLITY